MLTKSQIKYIQSLGHKKHRDAEKLFLAEGPKIVGEWLQEPGLRLQTIYATQQWIEQQRQIMVPVQEVTNDELAKISQLQTPNQVLAVVHQQEPPATLTANSSLVLALDTIQDPGNLGTIIRIADWFGVNAIVCSRECADIYNPKVVQSAMGSLARVRILYADLVEWIESQPGCRVYAAALEGQDAGKMGVLKSGVLVIGNESKGISGPVMSMVNVRITIPRKGKAESLNAAVATGILLSKLT
ncbi:MAG: RNA methyltransferase [Chitinophagaceae bacterium]|jgi:TrmH family RNA methyltransferase|nr:RNA methyltransferase [Chitinophagaceae bacterium]